jgi:hypothetical protein
MDKFHDDLRQDTLLQGQLQQIIRKAYNPATLQEAVAAIMDNQLEDIKAHAKDLRNPCSANFCNHLFMQGIPITPWIGPSTPSKEMIDNSISRLDGKIQHAIRDQIQAPLPMEGIW